MLVKIKSCTSLCESLKVRKKVRFILIYSITIILLHVIITLPIFHISIVHRYSLESTTSRFFITIVTKHRNLHGPPCPPCPSCLCHPCCRTFRKQWCHVLKIDLQQRDISSTPTYQRSFNW